MVVKIGCCLFKFDFQEGNLFELNLELFDIDKKVRRNKKVTSLLFLTTTFSYSQYKTKFF